ncbi:unnamed protein product [Urochloa humidicola]
MGKYCTTGIDLRIFNERVILLDTQASQSTVLIDMMRPDGSSTIFYKTWLISKWESSLMFSWHLLAIYCWLCQEGSMM